MTHRWCCKRLESVDGVEIDAECLKLSLWLGVWIDTECLKLSHLLAVEIEATRCHSYRNRSLNKAEVVLYSTI